MTDVFLVRQEIAPGKTEDAKAFFDSIDRDPEAVLDVLDEETVYTESAFLERGEDADHILFYIEASDGATVRDVFQELMAEPDSIGDGYEAFVAEFGSLVNGEPELVDVDLLYHLVNPERPTESG